MTTTDKYLGKRVTEFDGFATFDKPYHVDHVTMTSDEVTAMCPVTGQPDMYDVSITYRPYKLCLESKSLKLYLQSFRNEGLFVEQLAHVIAQDVCEALDALHVSVMVTQKPRGGIEIDAFAEVGEDV